ncbi:hypothetical protein B0H67DRAFT_366818 [Lasiosphaeris hirsuta]|uniref:Uncharacterized protein n=1 Tax=Lasiosphaeris hirsuta TaxID=260670 RepID=A0AA40DLA9_9PEZI|nr:hypothetical protein B0H67DRAFT_366818 [Lasiosphaeris hirsuta]
MGRCSPRSGPGKLGSPESSQVQPVAPLAHLDAERTGGQLPLHRLSPTPGSGLLRNSTGRPIMNRVSLPLLKTTTSGARPLELRVSGVESRARQVHAPLPPPPKLNSLPSHDEPRLTPGHQVVHVCFLGGRFPLFSWLPSSRHDTTLVVCADRSSQSHCLKTPTQPRYCAGAEWPLLSHDHVQPFSSLPTVCRSPRKLHT